MKEKLKELFKNKKFIFGIAIWVVVAIYLVSCIIFTAKNVYAYDMVDTGLWSTDRRELTLSNGDSVEIYQFSALSSMPYLTIIYDGNTDTYDCIYTDAKPIVKEGSKGHYAYHPGNHYIYEYVVKDTNWSLYTTMMIDRGIDYGNYSLMFTNYDLVDSNGEIFFKGAPTVPTITQTDLTGAKIVEKATAVIGLLIPLLIVSVVGFLAFRKGWKFLVTNLKRA